MANFPLLRANEAAWGVGTPILQSEVWALDRDRHYSINGQAGGTWAPSSQIVIGGLGLSVSGPASLANVTTLAATGAASFVGGLTTDELELSGSTTWPTFTARTLTMYAPAKIVGATSNSSTNGTRYARLGDLPVVRTETRGSSGGIAMLELPMGPQGSTLTSVSVWTQGAFIPGGGTLVRPTYAVRRVNLSGSSVGGAVVVSSTVTDSHASDASDWTDWVETTISGIAAPMVPDTSMYWLRVDLPYNVTVGEEQDMWVLSVSATYSITELRY